MDVTGVCYFDQRAGEFVIRPGPVFTQVLLVDEINRATLRMQSALLEEMAERQVTMESETLPLPCPYLVLAIQNPVELEGTFPLPEAQLDRFLLRVRIGYPSEEDEETILHRFKREEPLDALQPVISAERLLVLQQVVRKVQWRPEVERYLLTIVRAKRSHSSVTLGVSPRGSLVPYRACEAYAAMQGRDYVQPDDIKRFALGVLAHRPLTTMRAPAWERERCHPHRNRRVHPGACRNHSRTGKAVRRREQMWTPKSAAFKMILFAAAAPGMCWRPCSSYSAPSCANRSLF